MPGYGEFYGYTNTGQVITTPPPAGTVYYTPAAPAGLVSGGTPPATPYVSMYGEPAPTVAIAPPAIINDGRGFVEGNVNLETGETTYRVFGGMADIDKTFTGPDAFIQALKETAGLSPIASKEETKALYNVTGPDWNALLENILPGGDTGGALPWYSWIAIGLVGLLGLAVAFKFGGK